MAFGQNDGPDGKFLGRCPRLRWLMAFGQTMMSEFAKCATSKLTLRVTVNADRVRYSTPPYIHSIRWQVARLYFADRLVRIIDERPDIYK